MSANQFRLNRTYIHFGRHAEKICHVYDADDPQIMLIFQQDPCLSERDFGIVAFRRNGSIQCHVVDDLYSVDMAGKEELRIGRQADAATGLRGIGAEQLLNADILLWNIFAKAQAIPSPLADRLEFLAGRPARVICQWIRNAIENYETALGVLCLPSGGPDAFSERSSLFSRKFEDGHYTDEYIHRENATTYLSAECVMEDGRSAGWEFRDEKLICYAETHEGRFEPVKFIRMDQDWSWICCASAAPEEPVDSAAGRSAVELAAFSGMSSYRLLDGKRYQVLETSDDCGRQYLKIRNEAGEEIWVNREKALPAEP
jgi:hypothetical protein